MWLVVMYSGFFFIDGKHTSQSGKMEEINMEDLEAMIAKDKDNRLADFALCLAYVVSTIIMSTMCYGFTWLCEWLVHIM